MIKKIGIIICHRYHLCGGGKCFKAIKERAGSFSIYPKDTEVELVGYSTCGGCPGGNIEYVVDEMKKNGAQAIHLATGMIVGYPPCKNIKYFHDYITKKYEIKVEYGTHPIPEKYLIEHKKLNTWNNNFWKEIIKNVMSNEKNRIEYN